MTTATFTPTTDWQDVPAGAVLPAACQIRLNVTTGRAQARLANGSDDLDGLDQSYANQSPPASTPAKTAPFLVTAKAFVAGFKSPEYLIDGLIRRGALYSLTALTGHGKTATAMCLDVCVAVGRGLDGRRVEQGNIVYFAAENPDDVKARMILTADRMGLDLPTLPMWFVEGGFNIGDWADHIRSQVEASAAPFPSRSIQGPRSRPHAASPMRTTICRR
jgi:hypothetical protein